LSFANKKKLERRRRRRMKKQWFLFCLKIFFHKMAKVFLFGHKLSPFCEKIFLKWNIPSQIPCFLEAIHSPENEKK